MAAIFVLFVRRFSQLAWRPFRGFLFSFMASSAFCPIIYAGCSKEYIKIDTEAGASRCALTVFVYVTAVTSYGVNKDAAL